MQGFNENLCVLLILALYACLLWAGLPVVMVMVGFGVVLAAAIAAVIWRSHKMRRLRHDVLKSSPAARSS